MVLRSVTGCMNSSDWLKGGGMQDTGYKALQEDMQPCPRSLMDRRLKPNGELALRCPRCDSPNTKFCYYNNYSLSQPRYFCKTCRRYWTKGGTLRNVPVGGGCRKNKRFKRTSDHPSQTDPTNERNSCSPPNLEQSSLNFAPVPSVYFTLLNGGADGLGVAYSSPSLQQQHNFEALKVAAAADRPVMTANCNSNSSGGMMMMDVPSTATGTASHESLASLSNLNTFQSPPNLINPSGPDQTATLIQMNGDLSTIFEVAHHHHHENQQVHMSSPPAGSHVSSSERFHDVTGVHDHRLNSGFNLGISVEDQDNGQVLLPFDHEDQHQFRPPPPSPPPPLPTPPPLPHHEIKLTQLIMSGVQSPSGGGEICGENRPAANSYNWQLPVSEGLLDTSVNNINYWNGAGTWPDLSCYAPYTNPLI